MQTKFAAAAAAHDDDDDGRHCSIKPIAFYVPFVLTFTRLNITNVGLTVTPMRMSCERVGLFFVLKMKYEETRVSAPAMKT